MRRHGLRPPEVSQAGGYSLCHVLIVRSEAEYNLTLKRITVITRIILASGSLLAVVAGFSSPAEGATVRKPFGSGLAATITYTLADLLDETLAGALAGHPEACVVCGDGPIRVTTVDFWSSEVTVRCPHCGCELSGVVERHQLEVPA